MANMKDVAREAKVSVATVSNYINGKKVRSEAAKNIEVAIKKLNYVRNNAARLLKTDQSPFVVFVVPSVWSPFFSELTFWVQKYLNKLGFKMVLCISENDYEKEKSYVKMAEEQRAAGILSISYSDLTSHVLSDIPLVAIEKETTGQFSLISSDNYAGGQLAAKELINRNLEHLIFVGSTNYESVELNARKAGFEDFCNNHGHKFELEEVKTRYDKKQLLDSVNKIIERIISESKKQNIGIFAHTDETAFLLIKELIKKGIRIPEQVQVIGFDGWNLTPNTKLSLSTIRQPIKEIAETAVKQLNKEIKNPKEAEKARVMLPVSYRAGETTIN
ncbi:MULTISPECIES: LacI family DNA-binding transcriptional regulator [Lactobacillus]|uniref:LacI family DNA-binding transcriptional regulator n=1 Tax=Lactobacillus xujianguonis TaxID=2495899 RepID=A0A437SSM3_9LACO|nr:MULTISPECIES: LacI family DNA-binding transcriptional regulator [Lactobacillus]RVU69920.1 LacI family DNA-binding transcriptional regulator [Lactobacillus xujianguonis]RVU72371.1 LacI family DNA-binding transcriptional regulator [Lactobacillus xujianguonis]RVU73111.1 LacI family DNA-binding transcriptional regulator [Lactobacillus xujianguonis]